jgi:hypothetical protein
MIRYKFLYCELFHVKLSRQTRRVGCCFYNLSATLIAIRLWRQSMSNSSTPNFAGMGAMTDTLDFVKNLWGGMGVPGMSAQGKGMQGMGIPGMIMPSLSVEEINKQISDLKAVESWLTLNMNMLRSTIQALEVQSATIATLQSMSASFSAAVKPSPANKTPNAAPGSVPSAAPAATKEEAKTAAPAAQSAEPLKPSPAVAGSTKKDATDADAPLGNPAMWWNMLQDQFNQAVNTALASEKPAATVKPANSKVTSEKPQTSKPVKVVAAKKPAAPRAKKVSKTPAK